MTLLDTTSDTHFEGAFETGDSIRPPKFDEASLIDMSAWHAVNTMAVDYGMLPVEHETTRYVQEMLDVVTDGADVQALVTLSDELQASALPGYVVVSKGMLENLDFVEELLALDAHEVTHLRAEHANVRVSRRQEQPQHGMIRKKVAKIGLTRAFETEADHGAFEILRDREINAMGAVSLFDKLAASEAEAEESAAQDRSKWLSSFGVDFRLPRFKLGSPTHGAASDRSVNFQQMMMVSEATVSVDDLTPLPDLSFDVDPEINPPTAIESRHAWERVARASVTPDFERVEEMIVEGSEIIQRIGVSEVEARCTAEVAYFGAFRDAAKIDNLENIEEWASRAVRQGRLDEILGVLGSSDVGQRLGVQMSESSARVICGELLSAQISQRGADALTPEILAVFGAEFTEWAFSYALVMQSGIYATREDLHLERQTRDYFAETGMNLQEVRDILHLKLKKEAPDVSGLVEEVSGGAISQSRLKQAGSSLSDQEYAVDIAVSRIASVLIEDAQGVQGDLEFIARLSQAGSAQGLVSNSDRARAHLSSVDARDALISQYEYWHWEQSVNPLSIFMDQIGSVIFDEGDLDEEEAFQLRMVREENRNTSIDGALSSRMVDIIATYGAEEFVQAVVAFADKNFEAESPDKRQFAQFALDHMLFSEMLNPANASFADFMALAPYCKSPEQRLAWLSEYRAVVAQTQGTESTGHIVLELFNAEKRAYSLDRKFDMITAGHILDSECGPLLAASVLLGFDGVILSEKENALRLQDFKASISRVAKGLTTIESLVLAGEIPSVVIDGSLVTDELYAAFLEAWTDRVAMLLEDDALMGDKSKLLELFGLTMMHADPFIKAQVPSSILVAIVEGLDFDEATDFLFEELKNVPAQYKTDALRYLIEFGARTPSEVQYLAQIMTEFGIEQLRNSDSLGYAALADAVLLDNYKITSGTLTRRVGIQYDEVEGFNSAQVLRAMLQTHDDDSFLKSYVFDRWWFAHRAGFVGRTVEDEHGHTAGVVAEDFKIEDYLIWMHKGKEARLRAWTENVPSNAQYRPLSTTVDSLYLMSDPVKYYALRKVLLGEGGVLPDRESHDAFVDELVDLWIDFDKFPVAGNNTRWLLKLFLGSATEPELYQQLNPVLMDLTMRPPLNPVSTDELAMNASRRITDRLFVDGRIRRDPEDRNYEEVARRIQVLMTGNAAGEATHSKTEELRHQLVERFVPLSRQKHAGRYTPTEVAVEVGQNIGAFGVRGLQLAGQYFDIPDQEREQFMDVYDNVEGQTRAQAMMTLFREGQKSKHIKSLLDNNAFVSSRIGGGSLMTVYEFLQNDGTREAVSVKNPNVELRLSQTLSIAKKTLAQAREEQPDETNLALASAMLDDIERWILDELTDPEFEVKDAEFRSQNDVRLGGFDSGKGHYDIYVPESKPTGTRIIRRDEMIDGVNLTKLKVVDGGQTNLANQVISMEDFRDIASVTVRNFMHQLTDTGLVHSDLHPGNLAVMTDRRAIAVYDRYNLIRLQGEEQKLVTGLMGALGKKRPKAALSELTDYLFSLEVNAGTTASKDQTLSVLQAAVDTSTENAASQATIEIKRLGLTVPIPITLLIKDGFFLQGFARQAGFDSLAAAFRHTASVREKARYAKLML